MPVIRTFLQTANAPASIIAGFGMFMDIHICYITAGQSAVIIQAIRGMYMRCEICRENSLAFHDRFFLFLTTDELLGITGIGMLMFLEAARGHAFQGIRVHFQRIHRKQHDDR